nr:hypothetical protein [Tanacetum cinerariifolium]
ANGEGSCGLEWWRVVGCRESGGEEQGNRGEGLQGDGRKIRVGT